MVLENLLRYSQTQSGTVRFALCKEWLEDSLLQIDWNTASIISDANFDFALVFKQLDADLSGARRHGFARI